MAKKNFRGFKNNMQILSIQTYNFNTKPSFAGRGKPIDLKYILEKRANLLPKRVLEKSKNSPNSKSLLEIHNEIYSKLLDCKTLDDAKEIFPEFNDIKATVMFERDSVYKREFEERTKGFNFPLKMLQELWANLKTKDEVAQELGMKTRSSIDWALKQIGFVYFSPNYRTLLKASDEAGNKVIAAKTTAWNAAHPDLMRARNKHAAQFCKTDEYRAAHSKRMKARDMEHPERKEKISEFDKRVWDLCPDIKDAMSMFAMGESPYVRKVVMKKNSGKTLNDVEKRIDKGFYKRFWDAHPEMKEVLRAAKAQVRAALKKERGIPD